MSEGETEHGAFVWGTNLVIEDVQHSIRRFMRAFTLEGSSEALYHTLIKQVSHVTNHLGTPVSQHVSLFSCNITVDCYQSTAILLCLHQLATIAVYVQIMDSEEVFLNIDLQHMHKYNRELYGQLIAYPGEVIPLLDYEARSIVEDSIEGELPEHKSFTVSENLFLRQVMLLSGRLMVRHTNKSGVCSAMPHDACKACVFAGAAL